MAHDVAKDMKLASWRAEKEKKEFETFQWTSNYWGIFLLFLSCGVKNLMLTGELLTLTVTFAFLEVWKCRERK